MVRTKLYNGCSHTPMIERPQHPTRGQFTPEASQTQAPVTFATEPARRAGGGFTDHARFHSLHGQRSCGTGQAIQRYRYDERL